MRLHRTHTEFNEGVLQAALNLFESGPWKGNHMDRIVKFQLFWDQACAAVGMPTARVVRIGSEMDLMMLDPDEAISPMHSLTVLELFHNFCHEMQEFAVSVPEDACEQAHAWACSLYYHARPNTFIKSVRKGLIPGVTEVDLVELDDVGCAIEARQRDQFDRLAEQFMDSLEEDDHDLFDLMAEFEGEGN